MNINAAVIAAIASVVTAVTTAIFAYRTQNRVAKMQTETQTSIAKMQAENQASLEKLKDDLQQRKDDRQKSEKAEEILAKYREPLVQAAFELQSRCYNILKKNLLVNFNSSKPGRSRAYIIENTNYVFAQYFAWTEIIRSEVQFLNLGEVEATRELSKLQENIREIILSSRYGRVFRVFRGEQRAIGELMISKQSSGNTCIGYAAFFEKKEENFRYWFEHLQWSIEEIAKDLSTDNGRLMDLQHALVDLIHYLDPNYMRFDKDRCQKA